MRITLAITTAACLLSGLAAAQTAPGLRTGDKAGLSDPALATVHSNTSQCSFQKLSNNAAGVWTASITFGSSLEIGIYDTNTNKYTATNEAALLPGSGKFGLMLDPTGLYCVYDASDGVYYSFRAKVGTQFSASVTKFTALKGYVDPALGWIGGKLFLFWASGGNKQMSRQQLDVSTPASPKLVGSPVVVANLAGIGTAVHSGTPVTGPDGDVEALFYFEGTPFSNSDAMWKSTLDPAEKGIRFIDATGWANNGGPIGGAFLFSRIGPRRADGAFITGDTVAPGGTADIGGAASTKSNKSVTVLYLGGGVIAPIKFPAPFNVGAWGLSLLNFPFGAMSHLTADQTAKISFLVPNDPKLKGITLWFQGFNFEVSTTNFMFTNTAPVAIK